MARRCISHLVGSYQGLGAIIVYDEQRDDITNTSQLHFNDFTVRFTAALEIALNQTATNKPDISDDLPWQDGCH